MQYCPVPVILILFSAWPLLAAQAELIPAGEALNQPISARLAALAETGAHTGGWEEVAKSAGSAAFAAYEKNKLNSAESWYYVSRWSALFTETEAHFVPLWAKAVREARVGHANLPSRYATRDRAMGDFLTPELQHWLLGNPTFSDEFFALLTPVDYVPQVFMILNELYGADPAKFREYPSLALAIAVVYDLPPPPDWPHGQVDAAVLPRRWPQATDAFQWWVREDKAGRTYHRLTRLGADELKFVVDVSAPFAELEWSQRSVSYSLNQFARTYSMVRYRLDRAQTQTPYWPGKTYALSDILRDGGICCDQAYFATQAGKARGVPTLLFRGAGMDGRHAWFGFLDGHQKWQLDAGRYAEQRFITGLAYDPQTWRPLSDHELQFISDRFHALPSYRQSRVHALFAEELLRANRPDEAVASARKAVNYERRNLVAWEMLLAAQQAQGAKPLALEATLREAAMGFRRYPDLEIKFMGRLTQSLRARGETSLADAEDRRLAKKYQADRNDLSIKQAAEVIQRSFTSQPVLEQIRTYNSALDSFGRGAGIEFYDKIVVVFAEHLLQLNEPVEALRAVERARLTLKVEPNKQLDLEMKNFVERLKTK